MAAPDLHADLALAAPLVGTWAGRGRGEYPTIDSFTYLETVTFGHAGKPFLDYRQRTQHPDTGAPMHAELGYWRFPAEGQVEFVAVHPTGVTELSHGTVEHADGELRIILTSDQVATTRTAKSVTALRRRLVVVGDRLVYDVEMAAVGEPIQFHLSGELGRVG